MVFLVYTTGVPLIFELVIMYTIIKSVTWLLTVHYKLITSCSPVAIHILRLLGNYYAIYDVNMKNHRLIIIYHEKKLRASMELT